jgi:nucleoside-diphosphate-sugar epimerase
MSSLQGKTALVTGATGAVGPFLVSHLAGLGCRVRALVRNNATATRISAPVDLIRGDLGDFRTLRDASAGADYVFHLAARLHVNNPTSAHYADYVRTNVEGTRNLARASRQEGVKRFIFFSTISLYGPTREGETFTEESPLRPTSWYAQTKADAEQIVLSETPSVVLRVSAVYGPEMRGNYRRLFLALKRRLFVPIGPGHNRRTVVYVSDVCDAALAAAVSPEAQGQIYNVTDGSVHRFSEIINTMCCALGRRSPSACVPVGVARLAVQGIDGVLRLAGRNDRAGTRAFEKLLEDVAVNGDKIRRLGFEPRVALQEGWRRMVAAMSGTGQA